MEEYQTLLFGPDSLWVNVVYGDTLDEDGDLSKIVPAPDVLCEETFKDLRDYQDRAREEEKPIATEYTFDDSALMMYPNSGGLTSSWRFILRNHALEIKVGMGKRNGIIAKVRFSAEYLWAERKRLAGCVYDVHAFLVYEFFDAPVYLGSGEIHLCADTCGYDFSKSDYEDGFIRRSGLQRHVLDQGFDFVEEDEREEEAEYVAGPDQLHLRYRPITGFTFGTHKSAVQAVIYNKSNYIKYKAKKTTWFYVPWGENGWDGLTDVWRVELRFRRPFLHDARIESVYDLLTRLADLWSYGSREWLRYVVPGSDSNRARWQVQDIWQSVQMAAQQNVMPQSEMHPIIRDHKRVASEQQMVAQVVGCLITYHAYRKGQEVCGGSETIADTLEDFYPSALLYLDKKKRRAEKHGEEWDFVKAVRYKQVLYSQAIA